MDQKEEQTLDPVVAEADEEIHKQGIEAAFLPTSTHMHVNLHVTDWVAAQWEYPVLKAVISLIPNWKVQDLKHLMGDYANTGEGIAILCVWKKLMLYQGAPYNHHTLAGELEEVLWFIVPMAH